jgi:hypothetical protein
MIRIEDSIGVSVEKQGVSRVKSTTIYIFNCSNKCGNTIRASKGHFHKHSGKCKSCSSRAHLVKLNRSRLRIKCEHTKITIRSCKSCEGLFVEKTQKSPRSFCSKKCRMFIYNKNYCSTIEKRYVRSRTAKRNHDYFLTLEQFKNVMKNQRCYYCQGHVQKGGTGMDRIDSSQPYAYNNVVPCCRSCNTLKSNTLTLEETFKLVQFLKEIRGGVAWVQK